MDKFIREQNARNEIPPFARAGDVPLSEMRHILKACGDDESLKRGYVLARRFRDITRRACNYDMTSRCNLYCEGCFYFEGDAQTRLREKEDLRDWELFFKRQAQENGVRYGYFAGAEPALAQDRLRAAARHIERGSISTNGTVRIDKSLPYAILVSVWGDEDETEKFRGGGTFHKALRNFAEDPRARFIYTVNRENVRNVRKVARILDSAGASFSFNYYSPTASYLRKIGRAAQNDESFFRISNPGYHLHFREEDLCGLHETIGGIIDDFPKTCLHTKALNDWMLQGERYTVDGKTGVAVDCGGRNNAWHQAYGVDQRPLQTKCCTPNVDCRECRLYAPALSTALFRQGDYTADVGQFRKWLALCEQWGRLFLTDEDAAWDTSEPCSERDLPPLEQGGSL